jgi:hypothetical protein
MRHAAFALVLATMAERADAQIDCLGVDGGTALHDRCAVIGLSNGVYTVRIESGGSSIAQRFVV